MRSLLGIRGPGILYIKDIRAFLNTPAARRQIEAARRIANSMKLARKGEEEGDGHAAR